jgi:hypothetical protein
MLAGLGAWAQSTSPAVQPNTITADEAIQLRQEIDQLKKTVGALEQKLEVQSVQSTPAVPSDHVTADLASNYTELSADVKDIEKRLSETEKSTTLDRVKFGGDYRFEVNTLWGKTASYFDGMQLQNYVVKSMFYAQVNGGAFPSSVAAINQAVAANPVLYQTFANGITFDQLKAAMASMSPAMQQQLFQMLLPATYTKGYSGSNALLYTNRLRLKFDAKVADNITFTGRLTMYKVFGDSTGAQVFNGQTNSMTMDGTTSGVPSGDFLRVERAYFSWNNIGGSKFYLSIGRRPSTFGPPMNYRDDELRGGTPSGTLINYQFDGMTLGYNVNENVHLRFCYGVGYESGWGNGTLLIRPSGSMKDTQFMGANLDLWTTDKTLIQFTYAHAFDVADGFNSLAVFNVNPVNGEKIPGNMITRYTPSGNLGSINLAGLNITRKQGPFDFYGSINYSGTQPNGVTTPFGGMMSDPFETPTSQTGWMVLAGARYRFGNDDRAKLGFEFNHGSEYWFNFAQAEDDIVGPKTSTRGDVYEPYFTFRINDHFIFKADYQRYNFNYSGSGWMVGSPKPLNGYSILGFPTYKTMNNMNFGITARF